MQISSQELSQIIEQDPTIDFINRVGTNLFDGNMIVNEKYLKDIDRLFPNTVDPTMNRFTTNLISQLLRYQEGQNLLIMIIYELRTINAPLLNNYKLIEPQFLLQILWDLIYIDKQNICEQNGSNINLSIVDTSRSERIKNVAKAIYRHKQKVQTQGRPFNQEINQQMDQQIGDIEKWNTLIHIYEQVHSLQEDFERMVSNTIMYQQILSDLYKTENDDSNLKTFLDILMEKKGETRPYFEILSSMPTNWQLLLTSYILLYNKQEIDFLVDQKHLKQLFEIIYRIDTEFIKDGKLDGLKVQKYQTQLNYLCSINFEDLEIWKLYIAQRFSVLKLHDLSLFVLSQIYIDRNDPDYVQLIIEIILRSQCFTQCLIYVEEMREKTMSQYEKIFTFFISLCLKLGMRQQLFRTELNKEEEIYLMNFLNQMSQQEQINFTFDFILFLLKKGKILQAIVSAEKIRNLQENWSFKEKQIFNQIILLIRETVDKQNTIEQSYYRSQYPDLFQNREIQQVQLKLEQDFIKLILQS